MPTTTGISPKAVAATVTAGVTYLLGQQVLGLPGWATVAGQLVLVALAAYVAPAGDVSTPPVGGSSDDELLSSSTTRQRMQAGYSAIELLIGVVVLLILVILAIKLLDRV